MQKIALTWKRAYILLGVGMILLMARSFFGIDYTDESFYFALAKRFSQGDALLVDEWFPTQLIGALLLPLYKLYLGIFGNSEGIILCSRILYVLFACIVSAYMLGVFRKRGESCGYSLCVAMMLCIYVRAGIGTFSYYSLGLETFLLAILLLMDGENSFSPILKWVLAGINFSISVVCMPYMVLFFIVFVIVLFAKRQLFSDDKKYGYIFGGILISGMVFLAFFGGQILQGVGNFQEILMDPAHQGSIFEKVTDIIFYLCFIYLKYTWPLYMSTFIGGLIIRFKRIQNQKIQNAYRMVVYLEFLIQALYSRTYFEGGIIFAFLLLALQIQLMNLQIRDSQLEKYFLVPGIAFSFIWIIGSNVMMRVFNMGCLLADVWALKIILEDSKNIKTYFRYLRNLSVFLLFGVLLINRFFDVYRDNVIWDLDTQVTCGSMKGIFTTEDRAEEYETVVQELRMYTSENDRLAVLGLNPWVYLEAPSQCGAYSVWHVDFTDERNYSYYKKYPENIPNVIFLLNPSYGKFSGWRFGSQGSNTEGSGVAEVDGYLKMLLEEKEYETLECSGGTFYRVKE